MSVIHVYLAYMNTVFQEFSDTSFHLKTKLLILVHAPEANSIYI